MIWFMDTCEEVRAKRLRILAKRLLQRYHILRRDRITKTLKPTKRSRILAKRLMVLMKRSCKEIKDCEENKAGREISKIEKG